MVDKRVLMKWWKYHNHQYRKEEWTKAFEDIIDTYGVEKVLEVATHEFIMGENTPKLIEKCIETNRVEEMIQKLPNLGDSAQGRFFQMARKKLEEQELSRFMPK